MPWLNGLPRILCALAGLGLVGCYSPYRYSPYSPYGTGVPTYSPQAVPQFGPPVGSPTPVYPGGTYPPATGTFPSNNGFGGTLSPTPDPNSSFPPSNSGDGFSPTPNGFNPTPGTGTGLVPRYGDPETLPPASGGNTFENNSSPFMQDGASFQSQPASAQSVGMRYEPARSDSRLQLAAHQDSAASDLYGYDPAGYRWLRGLVDYDEEQQTWVLIYDVTPDPQDAYKGQITLASNTLLDGLRNDDAVTVEGRVDNSLRDPDTFKPQYRVAAIHGS